MSEIEICFKVCVSITSLWFVYAQDLRSTQLVTKENRELLVSTEIPAEHIDPASIDLTNLVNTLINASQPGSKNLFSLLSVTSHSSLSLHKLTLLVYNISNIRDIESTLFSTRYCYCLTNRTNDLTDFTAILLDVMGNSTSYLQELFKSSSILSVSQKNSSECIYICVMAGKTDSDLSQLWNMGSVTPLFNQTIMEEKHRGNVTVSLPLLVWSDLSNNTDPHWPKPTPDPQSNRVSTTTMATSTVTAPPVSITTTTTASFQTSAVIQTKPYTMPQQRTTSSTEATRTVATTSSYNITSIGTTTRTLALHLGKGTTMTSSKKLTKTGCPWRKEFVHKGSGKKEQDDSEEEQQIWGGASISLTKLQPCVLELCKFYSQCVCRGFSHSTAALQRYCVDSHRWYERLTAEICSRVKRVALSKNLKQKCVARMCVKT